MSTPSISVVIPTYNRPRALARALESVANQTTPADEIIVVDDGSTPVVDPTSFVETPVAVTIVRNESSIGAAGARNLGVAAARSDFIAFLDDDDTWCPSKLQLVFDCLARYPNADVVMHRTGYQAPSAPQDLDCSQVEKPVERMTRAQPPHLDGVVVRRALHLESPFDATMPAAEDLDYLITLAKTDAIMLESSAVLAVFGEDEPSAIGSGARIAGRLSLLNRHPEIEQDPQALAFFHVRLGQLQRRGGRRSEAIASFTSALRTQPTSSLAWKGFIRSLIGQ